MAMTVQEIAESFRALSFEEKVEVFHQLELSLFDEIPAAIREAQEQEVMRRREEYFSGKVQLIPGEQVERELDELLNEISRVSPRGAR